MPFLGRSGQSALACNLTQWRRLLSLCFLLSFTLFFFVGPAAHGGNILLCTRRVQYKPACEPLCASSSDYVHARTHAHTHTPVRSESSSSKGETRPQPCRYLSVGVSLACMLMLDALRVGGGCRVMKPVSSWGTNLEKKGLCFCESRGSSRMTVEPFGGC